MKLRMIVLFMSLISMMFITSCINKHPKAGLLMDHYTAERWEKDQRIFTQRFNSLGGEVLTEVANNDPDLQLEQAQKLIDEGVDVLVVVPVDLEKASKIIKLAHKNNIKVLSYDRLIKNCNLDYYVSFDYVDVGTLQADYLTSVCPQGKYILLGGPTTDNNSFLLRLGQFSVLQPFIDRGDIEIVFDQFANKWSEDEAYRLMQGYLTQNKDIHAVICANDVLAKGALKSLTEFNLAGKVILAGHDAELDACRNIVSGLQTMTVYKPIEAIATTAADIAFNMATGKEMNDIRLTVNNGAKMVPSILLPSMVVNKGTIKMTVVADGYLEEHNIFN